MTNSYRKLLFPIALLVLLSAPASQAAVTPVRLLTGNIALSVWDTDSTMVGAALQIRNVGTAEAESVQVTAVAVQTGSYQGPATLPVSLGTLNANEETIFNIQIKVPKTDGTRYLLTISGQYTHQGAVYSFALNRYIVPQAGSSVPVVNAGTALIKNPSTAFYPPALPAPALQSNADTHILIPLGPARQVFEKTPKPTTISTSTTGAPIRISFNTAQQVARVPPDPNAAAQGNGVVLSTFNTGITYSLNGGLSFTNVNLFAQQPSNPARTAFFPQDDGGLCCDQVVVYLPKQNLFVWVLQYWPVIACVANCGTANPINVVTQPNRLRIAWATPAAINLDFPNAWSYADLTADARPGVSSGLGAASNEWLDAPDVAYSDDYLYVGVDRGSTTPGQAYLGRRIVARLSLADLADTFATEVRYSFTEYSAANGINKNHFVQGAPGRMVLGALQDTSTFKVFNWRDDQPVPDVPRTVGISSITTDYSAPAPDGTDWYAVSFPGNVTGATYRSVAASGDVPGREEYLFALDAGRNAADGRAHPYVRIQTLEFVTQALPPLDTQEFFLPSGEYDLWNPNFAYGLAALATQGRDIGLTLAAGGGTRGFPQFTIGFKDDFVVYQVTGSNAAQVGRFGDYLAVRPINGSGDFATEVYTVLQLGAGPTCADTGCRAQVRYIRFGRPPPAP